MKWYEAIAMGVVLTAAILISFWIGQEHPKNCPQSHEVIRVDTLYLHDTITATTPIFTEKKVIERVLVPVTDTLRVTDTLFVVLDREQVMWQDTLCRVYASGIMPAVDSVVHYVSERIITERITEKTHPRWSLGLQGGYGASKDGLTPYIGIGISFNLLSW